MTAFIRALYDEDKAAAMRRGLDHGSTARFDIPTDTLATVPGSPFAYWVSDQLRSIFSELQSVDGGDRAVKQGLASADDFRFVRLHWEVPATERGDRWPTFAKGGRRSAFYSPIPTVVDWRRRGAEIRGNVNSKGETRSNIRMLRATERDFFFVPGVTWPLRGIRFSAQAVPSGSIFSNAGKMAFSGSPLVLLAVFNSSPFDALVGFFAGKVGGVQYEVGLIRRVPFPDLGDWEQGRLADLASAGWSLCRSLNTSSEVSHAFVVPAALQVPGDSFADRVGAWAARVCEAEAELERVQSEIDGLCFELYGISDDDRQAITEGFTVGDESEDGSGGEESAQEDDADDAPVDLDPVGLAAGLVSWTVGAAVGRFDVRLATGKQHWPSEPDPFDPLPNCSQATLTGDDGFPLQSAPAGYPLSVSSVLVDDPGHDLDLPARARAVFGVVFGDDADRWWTEVGVVLDPKAADLETWLRKTFFDYHLKTYSKSRRKAPVMWPLGTRSGSYRVWLYAHRVTPDSVFRVLNDIVGPKLYVEERRLSDLRQEVGPSASQRKAIDAQETFVGELREFRDELAVVAPLWAPDLNDGAVIVLAPFWRLFAHHRGWSTELKDRWRKLAAGDYDWAQLAMRLWPERVILKCAEDRSLAIAHGLEDVFWVADKDNLDKWQPRTVPTTPVEELIAARTNPTITTARQHPTP